MELLYDKGEQIGNPMSEQATDRTVLKVSGNDRVDFLQGLVSNDVKKLSEGLVYAALLSPQGKYLADFFLVPQDDAILIDVKSDLAAGLLQRLSMYKLRADVTLEQTDISVTRGLGDAPKGAFADPRHAALGWRGYGIDASETAPVDWNAVRVSHIIPESGIELHSDSYLLESGFERLNGVDFRKGCYVGQEVTARMKHKTELRKGLVAVLLDGPVEQGTEITSGGKPAGVIHTVSGHQAIAYLRLDRAGADMQAGGVKVALA